MVMVVAFAVGYSVVMNVILSLLSVMLVILNSFRI